MVVELHNRKKLEGTEDDDEFVSDTRRLLLTNADVITIKKSTLFWVCISVVMALYFYHIHLHPRREVLQFLQHTTHRYCNTSCPSQQTSKTSTETLLESWGVSGGEESPQGIQGKGSPGKNCLRLPTKVRMTDPTLLLFSYPISHLVVQHLRLKNFPKVITPNLISVLNPLVALIGVYFMMSSTRRPLFSRLGPRSKSTSVDGKQMSSMMLEDTTCSGGSASSSSNLAVSPPVAIPADPRLRVPFFDDTYISVIMNDVNQGDQAAPKIYFAEKDVSLTRLRLAAFFMWLRACLDTMDGVLARAHVESGLVPENVGSNFKFLGLVMVTGATVDVVTDFVGVFSFMTSVTLHLWSRKVLVSYGNSGGSSSVSTLLATTLNVRYWCRRLSSSLYTKLSPLFLARLIPVSGCIMIAFRGCFWEKYVPVFSQVFDPSDSPEVLQIERSFLVQLVYFLWGVSCVDALLSYLVVAVALNKHWTVMRWYAGYGWLWTLGMVLLSMYASSQVRAAVAVVSLATGGGGGGGGSSSFVS